MSAPAGRSFLLVSNGYGEDVVAAHTAASLLRHGAARTAGFPTVGDGRFYREKSIPLAGRGLRMPSEGFVRSPRDLLRDLTRNLAGKSMAMGRRLGKASRDFDALVVVGDPYLLRFTALFTPHARTRRIFVGVQQSEWYGSRKPFKQHYSGLERLWMRRFSGLIYVRDRKTRGYLDNKGMRGVRCTGNPMMDCFSLHPGCILPEGNLIGILPGSKQEAYRNLETALEVTRELFALRGDLLFAVALSPHLDAGRACAGLGLRLVERVAGPEGAGWAFDRFILPPARGAEDWACVPVILSRTLFGDIISRSAAVIGLSGTGNEQAAGCGKPVFAFWGDGPQITRKFLEAQKRLLGPSLYLFPPQPRVIAREIDRVLGDAAELRAAAENGRLRMSGRGSIDAMVGEIGRYTDEVTRRRYRE